MKSLFILLALLAPCCGYSAPAKSPNVIFILTDDQGWGDAHFAGHPYVKTPNLDRLASHNIPAKGRKKKANDNE
jgi:hypothetical protein